MNVGTGGLRLLMLSVNLLDIVVGIVTVLVAASVSVFISLMLGKDD